MTLKRLRKFIDRARHTWTTRRFSVPNLCLKLASRITYTEVLVVLRMQHESLAPLSLPSTCRMGFLTPREMQASAQAQDTELHLPYVREALKRGDRCFGVFEGEKLLSYSWYSRSATGVTQELTFEFPKPHIYMHHAFTLPEARGRRLHGASIPAALAALTEESEADMLAIVSAANVASLKSCRRGGFAPLGHFYLLGAFNRLAAVSGERCRRFGCHVTPRRNGFQFIALA